MAVNTAWEGALHQEWRIEERRQNSPQRHGGHRVYCFFSFSGDGEKEKPPVRLRRNTCPQGIDVFRQSVSPDCLKEQNLCALCASSERSERVVKIFDE
jgi:hypothetical protein